MSFSDSFVIPCNLYGYHRVSLRFYKYHFIGMKIIILNLWIKKSPSNKELLNINLSIEAEDYSSSSILNGGIDPLPAAIFACKDIINSASAFGSSHSSINSLIPAPS